MLKRWFRHGILAALLVLSAGVQAGYGPGLAATYYDQNSVARAYFTGSTVSRVDATVDFNWGGGQPVSGIGVNDFSVRWVGEVVVPTTGKYTFYTRSDDGVRLWVDCNGNGSFQPGEQLVNNWTDHGDTENSGVCSGNQTAGAALKVQLEFYERGGQARMHLSWSNNQGLAKQVIPAWDGTRGLRTDDLTPPSVSGVDAYCGLNTLLYVRFSEPVSTATGGDAGNYSLSGPGSPTVSAATLIGDGSTVELATSALTAGGSYTLTATNIDDRAAPANTLASGSAGFIQPGGGLQSGLAGTYYDQNGTARAYFTGSTVERVDATVDFNWGSGAPVTGIGANDFSIRWSGFVRAPATGSFTFQTRSDDGVRLWVGGSRVIDNWTDHSPRNDNSAAVALTAGRYYPVTLEFYERGGGAEIRLRWSGPGTGGMVAIPAAALFSCSNSVDHFEIDVGAGVASTCAPRQITFSARDSGNNILTGYTGTVSISTASNHGNWAKASAAGALSPDPDSDDNGQVGYTYAAADNGSMVLSLSNTHADDMTITIVDTGLPATQSTSATLVFRDNAFVIGEDAVQVAGRPQQMAVARWTKDPSTGLCAVDTAYAGLKALDGWLTRDVLDPGGAAPQLDTQGYGVVVLPSAAPAVDPSSNTMNLNFVAGQASFSLLTSDVGKYVLSLRDDTRGDASGVDVQGDSNALTTRPFALRFVQIQQGVRLNTGGTATTGHPVNDAFVAAGDTFSATVEALLWSAADDADNNGVPDGGANLSDNSLTPSFAWLTVVSGATPYTPAAGVLGSVGGGNLLATAYSGGRAASSTLSYSEVGSVTLEATASDYLGTTGVTVTGTSTVVGRFYPWAFELPAGASIISACVPGGGLLDTTYMDQPFNRLQTTLEAQAQGGTRTQNYHDATYLFTQAPDWLAENADDGTDLSSRLSLPAQPWVNGQIVVDTTAAQFRRPPTGAGSDDPDGPYDSLQLGVRVLDPGGGRVATPDMNPAAAGCGAGCDARALGTAQRLRFGRLKLSNASGSELAVLPVPMRAQYYNGTGFVTNTDDRCTTVAVGAVTLGNWQRNLNAGETTSSVAGSVGIDTPAASAGRVDLSAPGSGNSGSVDVTVDLSAQAWLRGRWDATDQGGDSRWYDDDAVARATFGVARDRVIFRREVYW